MSFVVDFQCLPVRYDCTPDDGDMRITASLRIMQYCIASVADGCLPDPHSGIIVPQAAPVHHPAANIAKAPYAGFNYQDITFKKSDIS